MHPGSLSLWSDYLQGVLSGAGGGRQGGFSAPAAREALLRALEDLSWERDRLGPGTGARARKELERVEGVLVGAGGAIRSNVVDFGALASLQYQYVNPISIEKSIPLPNHPIPPLQASCCGYLSLTSGSGLQSDS